MISMYLNCAQVWVRLVRLWCRISRRPQVTYHAPPMPPMAHTASDRDGGTR